MVDPTNEAASEVPTGTELSAPDAQDLRHQLQLANGLASSAAGGWLFLPRLDLEEAFNDNIYQAHSARRWDVINYAAPGISVLGDLPRIQTRIDYAPTLAIYDRTGPLNSLTQQLNATALVTVVPDMLYVDTRALAGVQSQDGGVGGLGTVGSSGGSTASLGLTRQNAVQTTSFGVSPYLLHRFGDWGNGKLGVSLNRSRSDSELGFTSLPLPTGGDGANSQTLLTTEQIAQFTSGERFGRLQDAASIDLTQSSTNAGESGVPAAGIATTARTTSTRVILTDQLSYAVTHALTVFGSIGHENISYSGANAERIDDLTWSLGATWTPRPDRSITLSYGHQQGANSVNASGYYVLTARTTITASYTNTLGTQLEALQQELNQASVSPTGALVNSQTGGPAIAGHNALNVAPGLYRFSTFALNSNTVLDRDVIAFGFGVSQQSATGGTSVANSTTAKTFSAQWTRSLWPELTFSSGLFYSLQSAPTGGNTSSSIAATAALQYTISETLLGSLRYSFFERSGGATATDMYQNLLILGITKTF